MAGVVSAAAGDPVGATEVAAVAVGLAERAVMVGLVVSRAALVAMVAVSTTQADEYQRRCAGRGSWPDQPQRHWRRAR